MEADDQQEAPEAGLWHAMPAQEDMAGEKQACLTSTWLPMCSFHDHAQQCTLCSGQSLTIPYCCQNYVNV